MIYFVFIFLIFSSSCGFSLGQSASDSPPDQVHDIGGNPSAGSLEIYSQGDLKNLCLDESECGAPYSKLSSDFIHTDTQEPLVASRCSFDYDPNLKSTFVLNRVDGSVNGLRLLLSKEDLFFLAWASIRYQINPYFLMSILSAESRGNCAAVSAAHGEGCFQITNTFGQSQLDQSYPDRVSGWNWTDRNGEYYPDNIFIDDMSYFGEEAPTEQFRLTLDPMESSVDGVPVSSVVNFNFGIIASTLYFHWQQYHLYHVSGIRSQATEVFRASDRKAQWQACAYNGGITRATNALKNFDELFLEGMRTETQNYAQDVTDYCHEFQAGASTYSATYTEADVEWLIDLLSDTYPNSFGINWDEVKNDVHQVFFADGTPEVSFVDDIKALVYVISTHVPTLAPEWPEL